MGTNLTEPACLSYFHEIEKDWWVGSTQQADILILFLVHEVNRPTQLLFILIILFVQNKNLPQVLDMGETEDLAGVFFFWGGHKSLPTTTDCWQTLPRDSALLHSRQRNALLHIFTLYQ